MVKVAVLGYGTIGSGVVEVLNTSRDIVTRNAGTEVEVKYVLDLRDFPGDPVEKILVHDYARIVNDPEVDIIVEVMGGTHPAYEFVKDALLKGKNVCTSNKALVAEFGPELVKIAKEKSVNFLFEASVGGGIPIIRPILRSLNVDTFYEITGILNGTTNYILTKMYDEGGSFEEALKEAQALGYAEADPSADVDGFDAARKIAILSGLMYGKNLDFEQLSIEGIRHISKIDMDYAKFLGKKIKLLGITYNINGEIYTEVAPHMIGPENKLYNVDDVKNGIELKGNLLGDTMFYGAGAGKLPTASAVVSDIIDEAKHLHTNIPILWSDEPVILAERGRHKSKFFIRVDRNYDEIKNKFDLEQLVTLPDYQDEYAVVTAEMTFAEFYEKIGNKEHVRSIVQVK
ncbi:MAG: homoserine dehydrogenase [Lachnospiraceae bacterium]|nr:homoserine dehydrogenase [Lachnospiraceae bacterium]MBR3359745.1 homoserine dehydrogenase [Lachnospiraceae bacterium]